MAPQIPDNNGNDSSTQGTWREWARHVLIELERMNAFVDATPAKIQEARNDAEARISALRQEHNKEVSDLRLEVALLKLKSGVWGAVGASIPILIAFLVYHLTKTP